VVDVVTGAKWETCPLCRAPANVVAVCETPGCWKRPCYEYHLTGKCWSVCARCCDDLAATHGPSQEDWEPPPEPPSSPMLTVVS
jgi:hypothetical protein